MPFLLMLASCGNDGMGLPKVFGGSEVPDEVMAEPRVVPSAQPLAEGEAKQWPLLGAVPPKPKDFTPQLVIDEAKQEMQHDRAEGEELRQEYEAAPPVLPSGFVKDAPAEPGSSPLP